MLINISPTLRIETAPRRKRAVATPELLSDAVTAGHYKASRDATPEELAMSAEERQKLGIRIVGDRRVFPDSVGNPIELGQEMDYIDWKAPESDHVWCLYQLQTDSEGVERYLPIGSPHETLADAEAAAHALL